MEEYHLGVTLGAYSVRSFAAPTLTLPALSSPPLASGDPPQTLRVAKSALTRLDLAIA